MLRKRWNSVLGLGLIFAPAALLSVGCMHSGETVEGTDPKLTASEALPSWHETTTRRTIVEFVQRVVDPTSPDFVPPPERIAVFDNDGTLWSERPVYFQLLFALDRVVAMTSEHPEWKQEQPFAAILANDRSALAKFDEHDILKVVGATHAGMTHAQFQRIVEEWIETARHERFDRPYSRLVYQPMLELLDYLRSNGFKTFIVSGGGIDFVRVFSESVYGIPPEQVIGSSIKTEFRMRDGRVEFVRLPELNFVNDKAGKPVGILQHIGRQPILAFGNSDGDFEMLEYTSAGDGARLSLLVHHDDPDREYAYERESSIGRLDRGLDEAESRGWIVVSMKDDWTRIFPEVR